MHSNRLLSTAYMPDIRGNVPILWIFIYDPNVTIPFSKIDRFFLDVIRHKSRYGDQQLHLFQSFGTGFNHCRAHNFPHCSILHVASYRAFIENDFKNWSNGLDYCGMHCFIMFLVGTHVSSIDYPLLDHRGHLSVSTFFAWLHESSVDHCLLFCLSNMTMLFLPHFFIGL